MQSPRHFHFDALRAFIFLLLAYDHTVHAYALNFAKYHFVADFDRSIVFDASYMVTNAIIMPTIFFIAGFSMLSFVKKQGWKAYFKNRTLKLGIPFMIGVPFIVPILSYPAYLQEHPQALSFIDYWQDVYLAGNLSASGPFWVLYALFLYSVIFFIFTLIFPRLESLIGSLIHNLIQSPLRGFLILFLITALLLTLSDFLWGSPWWFKVVWFFRLHGARFLLHAVYFLLGAGVAASSLLTKADLIKNLSQRWPLWAGFSALLSFAYIGYNLTFIDEGAYSESVRHALRMDGSLDDIIGAFLNDGFLILPRTFLLALLSLSLFLTLNFIFYRFCSHPSRFWSFLSQTTYCVFLFHEIPVIWLQYTLNGADIALELKVIFIFIVGVGGSYVMIGSIKKRLSLLFKISNV